MDVVVAVVAALGGALVVGPALNRSILWWVGRHVVVPALLGLEVAAGEMGASPARCAACGAVRELRVGPVGLVPWLAVRGRCPGCGAARPWWTAAVELATGAGFGLAAVRFGWSAELPAVLVFVAGLVAISAVDLVHLRIPTRFVHVAGAATVLAMGLATLGPPPVDALAGALLGGALYGGFLGLFWLASPAMLGFGDVRLATLVGAVVGWLAWEPDMPVEGPIAGVLATAFAAGVAGTAYGLVLLAIRRSSQPFAFGPAMAVGALIVVLG